MSKQVVNDLKEVINNTKIHEQAIAELLKEIEKVISRIEKIINGIETK